MELTQKQQEGLNLTLERYKNREKFVVISGYAGTGKSTLVRFIIDALAHKYNIDPEIDVVYTSFTGKATQVLQKKGNKNVSTLHKLLYFWKPLSEGGFKRKPVYCLTNPDTETPYKVVVVDEVSMIPKELLQLLFTHKVFIICLRRPRSVAASK